MKPRCVALLTVPGRYRIPCKLDAHHSGAHFGTSPFDSRDVRWHDTYPKVLDGSA